MLIAITVVPTAAARLDISASVHRAGRLRAATLDAVTWMLHRPLRRAVCVLAIVAASAAVIIELTPPAEYLPEGEEAKAFATMNAPPGYNLATMSAIAERVQSDLLPLVGDDPRRFGRGETDVPALRYVNLRVAPHQLRVVTEPLDGAHILPLMDVLTARFEEEPGMRAFVSRGSIITSNDGGTRSVDLDISGPDLAAVYAVALAAYRRARDVFDQPRILPEPPTLALAQPLIEVRPDWPRIAELGIDVTELGLAVAALTDGAYVDEFFLGDDKIDIFLYGDQLDAARMALTDNYVVALSFLPAMTATVLGRTQRR